MLDTQSYILQRYGVSAYNGFLPDPLPLQRLPDPYFAPWESLMDELPTLIKSRSLRSMVDEIEVLNTHRLLDGSAWRRAYVVLSFLTHAYIWGGDRPAETLPPTLTCPFLEVADYLGLPPTATYAAFNLWNFAPTHLMADLTIPDDVCMLSTFTGTPDEAWFYIISISIEARGAAIMPTMLDCFAAVRANDVKRVAQCLQTISACIVELGKILDRMYEKCDPQIFYHQIRPFLAGSKGMAAAGLPDGVFYDEGKGRGQWRQYSGGSNAQSSLIQLLDVLLGVEHFASGSTAKESSAPSVRRKQGYIEEMRNYMPRPHRHFLSYVGSIANIREYAMSPSSDSTVQEMYRLALANLTQFRDKHIRIVSRYIIAPARMMQQATAPVSGDMNIATASSTKSRKGRPVTRSQLSGTGGTMLIPFLKQTRDETRDAAIVR